jgi:hypothetical protein
MAATQPSVPAPVNPPDELGPPPPPPPPPANPPVLNPLGVHFQPQVPGTEMGPMTHRYVPRQDPIGAPGMFYPGQQMPALMVSGLVGALENFGMMRPSGLMFAEYLIRHKHDRWNWAEEH